MHRTPASLSALALLTLAGCGGYSMGVTPGGMQDMNHARQLIANGMIPGHDD